MLFCVTSKPDFGFRISLKGKNLKMRSKLLESSELENRRLNFQTVDAQKRTVTPHSNFTGVPQFTWTPENGVDLSFIVKEHKNIPNDVIQRNTSTAEKDHILEPEVTIVSERKAHRQGQPLFSTGDSAQLIYTFDSNGLTLVHFWLPSARIE